jgi:hypothetical protein
MIVLYNAIIRSRLECASVYWNSLTLTDPEKLKHEKKICHFALLSFLSVLYFM